MYISLDLNFQMRWYIVSVRKQFLEINRALQQHHTYAYGSRHEILVPPAPTSNKNKNKTQALGAGNGLVPVTKF